ncbi:MAG: hypothetical protein U1F43_05830 [Myxococcota bacterium]
MRRSWLALASLSLSSGCAQFVAPEPDPAHGEKHRAPLVLDLPSGTDPGDVLRHAAEVLVIENYPIVHSDAELGVIETAWVKLEDLPCRWDGAQETCRGVQRATVVVQRARVVVSLNRLIRPNDYSLWEEPAVADNVDAVEKAQVELYDLIVATAHDHPLPKPFRTQPVATADDARTMP